MCALVRGFTHKMWLRVPNYSGKTLTEWHGSRVPSRMVRLLKYWADRTATILDLLDQTEVIIRTACVTTMFVLCVCLRLV